MSGITGRDHIGGFSLVEVSANDDQNLDVKIDSNKKDGVIAGKQIYIAYRYTEDHSGPGAEISMSYIKTFDIYKNIKGEGRIQSVSGATA